jgi:cytochrome c peroxidase
VTALVPRMFFDPAWSATGRMSWVSRRDPAHASGPPRRLAPGQLPPRFGGADPRQPGPLVVPSPMHTPATPQCTEHFFGHDDAADDSADNGPAGDLTWIGRVDRGRDITGARAAVGCDRVRLPPLSSCEMGNASPQDVMATLRPASCAPEQRRVFGADAPSSWRH